MLGKGAAKIGTVVDSQLSRRHKVSIWMDNSYRLVLPVEVERTYPGGGGKKRGLLRGNTVIIRETDDDTEILFTEPGVPL